MFVIAVIHFNREHLSENLEPEIKISFHRFRHVNSLKPWLLKQCPHVLLIVNCNNETKQNELK